MSIEVRSGRIEDLPDLSTIYDHYVQHDHATFDTELQDRRAWFDDHADSGPHRLLVAAGSDDQVLGYATSSTFRARAAYATTVETTVYLAAGATGRGIGSALYGALLPILAAESLHRAVAGIALPNDASLALHRRFGYCDVGTYSEVGHKLGRFWDVHWMQRELSPAD